MRLTTWLSVVWLVGGCSGENATVDYQPHAVLDLPTVTDADGAPDIADPHVIRAGDHWYLYATQTKRDLMVWVSDDLQHWRVEGPVWTPTAGTWNAAGQVWAPHVDASPDGNYILYYTANMQIGVATSDSPLGPFVEVYDHPLVGGGHGGIGDGQFHNDPLTSPFHLESNLLEDFRQLAIDAWLLRASAGRLFLYFAAYQPLSTIRALPMRDPLTPEDSEPVLLLEPQTGAWDEWVVEAPCVLEHDGRIHLMYSGNFAATARYAIGVATASDPLGPFERDPRNPLLATNESAGFFGPGHNGVVKGNPGDWLMFYHTKVSAETGIDRRIRYTPLTFDADNRIQLFPLP